MSVPARMARSFGSPIRFRSLAFLLLVSGLSAAEAESLRVDVAYAWGHNGFGDCGVGHFAYPRLPLPVLNVSGASTLTAGSGGFATMPDGSVRTWGLNNEGQRGLGTKQAVTPYGIHTATTVPSMADILETSSSWYHSYALRKDGSILSWGANTYGMLGDGTFSSRLVPGPVMGIQDAIALDHGNNGYSSFAVRSDRTLLAWGRNNAGQLGDGTLTNRTIPVQVVGLDNVVEVEQGWSHVLALRNDGNVWSWGNNDRMQLGGTSIARRFFAAPVPNLTDVIDVEAGGFFSIALKSDGTVWTWGDNPSGQLGDGTFSTRQDPVQVSGLSNVVDVEAGEAHVLALLEDGTVVVWGQGNFGLLGNGSNSPDSPTPKIVSSIPKVDRIAAASRVSYAWTGKPTNSAPIARSDTASLNEDSMVTIRVLDNDWDADGDTLAIDSLNQATMGQALMLPDGTISYKPNRNTNGTDRFTYSISDGKGGTASAEVTVTIMPVNDAPEATADAFGGTEDQPVLGNVLSNDSDLDGPQIQAVLVNGPISGSLSLDQDGTFRYEPDKNWNGSDSFTYQASDGSLTSETVAVTLDIAAENDAPTLASIPPQQIDEGLSFRLDLEGEDVDEDALTFSLEGAPEGCTIDPQSGSIRWSPSDDGTFTIRVSVSDGSLDAKKEISLLVRNVAPTAAIGGDHVGKEGRAIRLSGSASDPSTDDTHTFAWNVRRTDGTEAATGTGEAFAFVPADDGTYEVHLTATDDDGGSNTVSSALEVSNVSPQLLGDGEAVGQYSDSIDPILIRGTDVDTDTISLDSVQTSYDGGSYSDGLPQGLLLIPGDSEREWKILGRPENAPGNYRFKIMASDEDGGETSTVITLAVPKEDARASSIGIQFFSTNSSVDIPLRAIVRDISSVPSDPAWDGEPGDIRNANISFIVRETGEVIATRLPVSLLEEGNSEVGLVEHPWTVNLGSAQSVSFTLGIVVDGWYHRNSSADNVVITVSRPTQNFITGGGSLLAGRSYGILAATTGTSIQTSFNVRYNKNGLKGQASFEFQSQGRSYQLKVVSFSSLSLATASESSPGWAQILAKATLSDVTDPLMPVTVATNIDIQLTTTDGPVDSVGIEAWQGSRILLSSDWFGLRTNELPIRNGKVQIN